MLFTNACKTDVDIAAPYKETAVIYGLLDISAPVQLIKINKMFSGKGDATVSAQIADSINFNPADLIVTLERVKNNVALTPYILDTTTIAGGADGMFTKAKNIIYATHSPLEKDVTYKLVVENKKTGYKAEATTEIIDNIILTRLPTRYSFVGTDNKYTSATTFEWPGAKNAKIYQATFRFHYKEFKTAGDTAFKYIDWLLTPIYASDINGGGTVKTSVKGEDFFTFLKSQKEAYFSDNSFKRIAWRGQVLITAAGEDYQIYKDLNAPSSSNFQEKPIYTNVKNGLGILSTRVTTEGPKLPLSQETLPEFVNGKYTNDLGFIR